MPNASTTLVITTATAACSVALIAGGGVLAERHETVGRGHAERLVPMIAELPGGGRADRILVDCGPGSFTGLRVGLAAAIGLGIGWGVPVTGFTSTALIAAAGLTARPLIQDLAVVLEGGHGELFMQVYDRDLAADALCSLPPAEALARLDGRPAIGSGVRFLRDLDAALDLADALPRAADAVLLPPHLTQLPPRPIYGRAPDAKLPGGVTP